jgi:thiamine biosynthesis lipoprotein
MRLTVKKTPPVRRGRRHVLYKPLFLIPLLLFPLSGCGEKAEKKAERSVFAMDTLIDMAAYGDGADAALEACEESIKEIESRFSTELSGSEIQNLNLSGGVALTVSDAVAGVLKTALEVSEKSGGAFDITVYPLVRAWGFIGGSYRVPPDGEISELLERVGYANVGVDGNTVTLKNGAEIDLGGIAKGYAADALKEVLARHGVDSGLISLGGNVLAYGTKPDGGAWRIGIAAPDGSADIAGILSVKNATVVTSGSYQRYFEENGVVYGHILDPATGRPAETDLKSVTIVCDNGALADALSTALFVLGEEKALSYHDAYGGFEAVLITADDRMVCTSGLKDCLTETVYAVEYR